MSKPAILIVFLYQLTSLPHSMDAYTLFDIAVEVVVFLIAVALGSGLRVMMKAKSRQPYTRGEVWIIFGFGLSLGGAVNYALLWWDLNVPRPLIVWLVSLCSEFILIWLESRYPKIFDGIFNKATGIDLDEDDTNEVESEIDEYE